MKKNLLLNKIIKILIILVLGIITFYIFKPNYLKLHEFRAENSRMRQKLFLEKKRVQHLKKELNGLSTDPEWIEKVAREKLGWCAPDETIYRIQTNNSKSHSQ